MINKIKELSREIAKANKAYYNSKKLIFTDKVYDAKKDDLKKALKSFKAKDSKEQKIANDAYIILNGIGAEAVSNWEKVTHSVPMGSLDKINSIDELDKWYNNNCKGQKLFLTEKLDGISVDTEWKDGKLIQGSSRGDGNIGEDITANVINMQGIPKSLNKSFTGNIRGEIVLTKSARDKYLSGYSALRNAACGLAKRYDGFGSEHLTVLMYKVEGKDFKTEAEQFAFIKELGLIAPSYYSDLSLKDTVSKYNAYKSKLRDGLDYDIDGLVIRINDMYEQISLGETHDKPKGAVAFKFDAAGAEAVCTNIVWQVGNSGRITPVAEFEEVEILGTKVSRASLYNYSYVKEIGIDIGAKLLVIKANDVIPRVEEVTKSVDTVATYPKKCPSCNTETVLNGEYLMCPNKKSCPVQVAGRLKVWVNELNILEWGTTLLDKLAEQGLATDIDGLYALKQDDLAKLDRLGDKSAKNLIESLDKHREVLLCNLIGGLGIEGVATSTTQLVIDAGHDSLEKIRLLKESDLEKINGFGSIRAKALAQGLKDNKGRIDNILKHIKIKSKIIGSLNGKSFCFTGAMVRPRKELQTLVEANGGANKKSVGKGVTYLVIDDPSSGSSKAQAARKLGTALISEKQFLEMI